MRLPAKNATAPVMAFVLAVAGAHEAAAQGIKEQQVTPIPGPSLPGKSMPARPVAAPELGTGSAKILPLAREAERSVSAPSVAAPRAVTPADRLHSDGGLRGAYWRGT